MEFFLNDKVVLPRWYANVQAPNCNLSTEGRLLYIVTLVDILENTELTLKYNLYDPSL